MRPGPEPEAILALGRHLLWRQEGQRDYPKEESQHRSTFLSKPVKLGQQAQTSRIDLLLMGRMNVYRRNDLLPLEHYPNLDADRNRLLLDYLAGLYLLHQ